MLQTSVVAVFCEDVREEKAGSDTILGVFPDNINVSAIPGMLPRMGIYVRVHIDPEPDPGAISIRLQFPDGAETPLTTLDPALVLKSRNDARNSGHPIAGLISKTVATPFPLPQAGRILVWVKVGDTDYLAAALNVQQTK